MGASRTEFLIMKLTKQCSYKSILTKSPTSYLSVICNQLYSTAARELFLKLSSGNTALSVTDLQWLPIAYFSFQGLPQYAPSFSKASLKLDYYHSLNAFPYFTVFRPLSLLGMFLLNYVYWNPTHHLRLSLERYFLEKAWMPNWRWPIPAQKPIVSCFFSLGLTISCLVLELFVEMLVPPLGYEMFVSICICWVDWLNEYITKWVAWRTTK